MSSGLMDTEPGGESNHLRSFQGNVSLTFRPEPETQPDAVDQQQEQDKTQRGARTAENIRYGQAISEGGMGGKTTEAGGSANQAPQTCNQAKIALSRPEKSKVTGQGQE
ncbi:MAG: hypothetical protein LQ338_001310 [Usnochroma carphineum]|nr:MAG: hypothetical protein LQ338_001310 [Usnochroma carphineum]